MKLLLCLFFSTYLSLAMATTILIDPGHGGDDVGAKGQLIISKRARVYYEKDLALQISKRIFTKLKAMGHDAYLTRSVDRTLTLQERADIAEKVKADLFISVHLNSNPNHASHGCETYYLNNSEDWAIKKVEKTENNNLHGDQITIHHILTDLVIERTVADSKSLALLTHSSIKQSTLPKYAIENRGIKAGLFYVLALSKRPGLLLEVGFISNPSELKKMMSPEFQESYATAVVSGIAQFIKQKKK